MDNWEQAKKLSNELIAFMSGCCFGFLLYGLLSLTTYP